MPLDVQCEGAPRDLGLDQGRGCRSELRARFERGSRWSRWLTRAGIDAPPSARLARDLSRHFPQQSEAIEGMARGAGIPFSWFTETLARELSGASPTEIGKAVAIAAGPSRTAAGHLIARSLCPDSIVRRSRPEGGFRSVEVTLPWLTAALAGVNERGLAAVSVSLPGAFPGGGCAAPALLLVQDCLARFDSLAAALDWCTGRPSGGRAAILLADARGSLAGVAIDDGERRVVRPEGGFLAEGGGEAGDAIAALRAAPAIDVRTVAGIFATRTAGIDPAGRRITVLEAATAPLAWFEV